MRSKDLLSMDHKLLIGALDVLLAMADQAERDEKINQKDVETILEFLNGFGDRLHQGEEEDVLFPALRYCAGSNHQELCALVFEHNRQRSLIHGIQESLLAKKTNDFIYYVRRLNEMLRTHILAEEQKLFPLIDAAFQPAEDERVAAEMRGFDKAWQQAKLPGQLQSLAEMELKYLTRA
jgi:hemerythrin-like domain-containing protein